METFTNEIEMYEILDAVHRNPHHILGMHEIEKDEKRCLIIRAFIPTAKEILVIDEEEIEMIVLISHATSRSISEKKIKGTQTISIYLKIDKNSLDTN